MLFRSVQYRPFWLFQEPEELGKGELCEAWQAAWERQDLSWAWEGWELDKQRAREKGPRRVGGIRSESLECQAKESGTCLCTKGKWRRFLNLKGT